jgi:hypothetical protein
MVLCDLSSLASKKQVDEVSPIDPVDPFVRFGHDCCEMGMSNDVPERIGEDKESASCGPQETSNQRYAVFYSDLFTILVRESQRDDV